MQRSVPKFKTTGWLAATVAGLFLAIFALPGVSFALGIGTINVKSALNQPLDAEIDLLGITPEDLEGLVVASASQGVYERMGMELTPLIQRLLFQVAERPGSRFVIQVSSPEPVRDPFLSFLIEVNWRNGRVLREFTLLLDPPSLTDEKPAPTEMAETAPPPEFTVGAAPAGGSAPVAQLETPADLSALAPPEEIAPVEEPATPADGPLAELAAEPEAQAIPELVEDQPTKAASAAPSGDYTIGPVKKGARLWKLAEKTKPDGVSVEQMMLAYLRDNPEAFFGKNVSMLKEGAILRIEDSERLTEISTSQAIAEITKQHSKWLDFVRERQSETSPVAAASLKPMVGKRQKAPVSNESDPDVVAAKEKALLELLTPSDTAGSKSKVGVAGNAKRELERARDELALSTEAVEAARKENVELKGRIGSLEDQMASMQNLLVLKDQEMQAIQGGAPIDSASGEKLDAMPGAELDVSPGAAAVAPAAEKTPSAEKTESGFLGDRLTVATVIGAIILVSLVAVLVVRSRRKAANKVAETDPFDSPNFEDEYGDRIEDGVEIVEPNGSKFTLRSRSRGPDLAPLTNLSQPSGNNILAMEPGEIDPVSEAEVYLAYGKHEKAEEVVRASIKREPDSAQLRLKLLEILYQRRDQKRFLESAEEVYAALGDVDEVWGKVTKWGQELCPGNPLFSPQVNRFARPEAGSARLDIDSESPFPLGEAGVPVREEPGVWQAEWVNKGTVSPLVTGVAAERSQPTADPRPDIKMKYAETQAAAAANDLQRSQEEALEELAASFVEERQKIRGIDQTGQPTAPAAKSEPRASGPGGRGEYFLVGNQVDTKLDLARAYLDMGDKDGSRELLMEVVAEGDSRQKDEARRLLDAVA